MNDHKFPYQWTLKDAAFSKRNGLVFSCFACGGGSTMGYKLAGYDVIGCNEIDQRMMYVYCQNHNPRFPFLAPIQEFKNQKDLPPELYNLDILDGSPPCSAFSVTGDRQKVWGVEKRFREGQEKQVLDTLFFDFIDLAKRLQPKVVIAENVRGLVVGEAKNYVRRIHDGFDDAGYYVQHFLLDGADMGLPQRRERVFFVCLRKDLATPFLRAVDLFTELPYINMTFNEQTIPFQDVADFQGKPVNSPKMRTLWENRQRGDKFQSDANIRMYGKKVGFNQSYVYLENVCPTLTAKTDCLLHFEQPRYLSRDEVCKISSFPLDYDFTNQSPHYVCGMSVPPVMMAQVASRVWDYWLSKINKP